jgi:SAM-dependent methyltransferase
MSEPLRPLTPRTRLVRTAKEVARHGLHTLGVKRRLAYLESESAADRFEQIYEQDVWTRGNPDNPGSGAGSTLSVTSSVRRELPALLDRLDANVVLDLGCGDYTWMQGVEIRQRYVGADIVPSVIAHNQERYGSPTHSFVVADAVQDPLPDADVVLCREVLFHLSFDDIRSLLANVLASERRYLIATTDRITMFNADIRTGDYRPLDLERRPFRLGRPVTQIDDGELIGGRRLAVWDAHQVARGLRLPGAGRSVLD